MVHRIYLLIILCGLLGIVGWFGYKYYIDTQTRISILTSNNAKLQTAQKQTAAEFEQYRNNVQQEIEDFKAAIKKQQLLNDELSNNLKIVNEKNKVISKILANTDIIKNSLADPNASEERINEEVDKFFGGINCATNNSCVQSNP